MTKEEMAKAYAEGFSEEYRVVAYDAFLCGYDAKCSSEIPNDLEEASNEYAEKHGFRVPYDGSDNFYDEVDVKASKEGFIAGAKWAFKQK